MRLSAKILENVSNINHWNYSNQAYINEGQYNEIYLQLVDVSKNILVNSQIGAISDCPIRYIPQGTNSLKIILPDLDENIEVVGINPFSDDKSIWKFTLTDLQVPNSGNFELELIEDGVLKKIYVKNGISVQSSSFGGC